MKSLMILALGALCVAGCDRGERAGAPGTPANEMVRAKDPVCGMMVNTSSAKDHSYQGAKYYFCSKECHDRFEKAPATYLTR